MREPFKSRESMENEDANAVEVCRFSLLTRATVDFFMHFLCYIKDMINRS